MPYRCDLSAGQQLYLGNVAQQTVITLVSQSPGQQQQASSQFSTGEWTALPEVYRTDRAIVIRITTLQDSYRFQIQNNRISVLQDSSFVSSDQKLPMQEVDNTAAPNMQPMKSMQPMQPMVMGDMQMSLNPMEMKLGNMEMRIGNATPTANSASTRRFCSQCGAVVKPDDRFCASCGVRLN